MKKLMMIAAAALLAGSAFAQKPTAGSITLETQLNFQTGTAPVNFFTPNIRARYFLSEGMAVRVQFAFLSDKNTITVNEKADGSGADGEIKQSNSQFVFRPGIEKHFAGTAKLAPYVGAEINLTMAGAKEEWDQAAFDDLGGFYYYEKGTTAEVKGTWYNGNETWSAGTTIGLNLVAGADFFVWDNLYLGAELGWGFNSFKAKDMEASITYDDGTGTMVTDKYKSTGDKMSGFAMMPSGFLHLGWMLK